MTALRLAGLAAALLAAVALLGCGSPAAGQTQPPGSIYLSARNVAFVESRVEAPADAAFQLWFENHENVPHNVNVTDAAGTSVARGQVFTGPAGQTLDVPALTAGSYRLLCDVHPETMRAELVAN